MKTDHIRIQLTKHQAKQMIPLIKALDVSYDKIGSTIIMGDVHIYKNLTGEHDVIICRFGLFSNKIGKAIGKISQGKQIKFTNEK